MLSLICHGHRQPFQMPQRLLVHTTGMTITLTRRHHHRHHRRRRLAPLPPHQHHLGACTKHRYMCIIMGRAKQMNATKHYK